MSAVLILSLAVLGGLLAILGIVTWRDEQAAAERRRQYRDDDCWRAREASRRKPR